VLLEVLEPEVLFTLPLLQDPLYTGDLRFQLRHQALFQRAQVSRLLGHGVTDPPQPLLGRGGIEQ
jgi:hypothetical protein